MTKVEFDNIKVGDVVVYKLPFSDAHYYYMTVTKVGPSAVRDNQMAVWFTILYNSALHTETGKPWGHLLSGDEYIISNMDLLK